MRDRRYARSEIGRRDLGARRCEGREQRAREDSGRLSRGPARPAETSDAAECITVMARLTSHGSGSEPSVEI
jgi:hypothetical protein